MIAALAQPLDRLAIRLATGSVNPECSVPAPYPASGAGMFEFNFFAPSANHGEVTFQNEHDFEFPSSIASSSPVNNRVSGRFYESGPNWKNRPTVILLHGWNGELGYQHQFPLLARGLNARGLNAAMLWLPYHGARKPPRPARPRNFIAADPQHSFTATKQALADVRTLVDWLSKQTAGPIGLWGFSLGGWLAGLLCSVDSGISFATLLTPIVEMDRAVVELPFCAPLRHALVSAAGPLQQYNLNRLQLRLQPGRILLIKGIHDLFVPGETLESLWETWGRPEMWRVRHGHISVLLSVSIMRRAMQWMSELR